MSDQELTQIMAIAETQSHSPGDEIFSQGDKATALYVISYGSVRIHREGQEGNEIPVATLGTGGHFGEMAFIDEEKRSATVTAIEKTDVVKVSYVKLMGLLEANPQISIKFYRALAKFLCGRLRLTTTDLSFAREKNLRHF